MLQGLHWWSDSTSTLVYLVQVVASDPSLQPYSIAPRVQTTLQPSFLILNLRVLSIPKKIRIARRDANHLVRTSFRRCLPLSWLLLSLRDISHIILRIRHTTPRRPRAMASQIHSALAPPSYQHSRIPQDHPPAPPKVRFRCARSPE